VRRTFLHRNILYRDSEMNSRSSFSTIIRNVVPDRKFKSPSHYVNCICVLCLFTKELIFSKGHVGQIFANISQSIFNIIHMYRYLLKSFVIKHAQWGNRNLVLNTLSSNIDLLSIHFRILTSVLYSAPPPRNVLQDLSFKSIHIILCKLKAKKLRKE